MKFDLTGMYNDVMKEIKNENNEEFTTLNNTTLKNEKNVNEQEKDFYYDEEELIYEYEDKWSYQIRERGEDYYYSNHVLNVYKNKNKYIAKVEGNSEKPYNVTIEVKEHDLNMECSCPCTYPCKHEYAVLMAITDKSYEYVELKVPVKEREQEIASIIKDIPAEEIKQFLLSPTGKAKVIIETNTFNEHFRKYLPTQKYDFYYNNLYNNLILEKDTDEQVKSYLNRVKQYISGNDFKEVIKILKAIVEAYKDSNKLNFDEDFIDIIPNIGMFLRVTYRKANDDIKQEILSWVNKLEKEYYYNNYYLEDIMLNIK